MSKLTTTTKSLALDLNNDNIKSLLSICDFIQKVTTEVAYNKMVTKPLESPNHSGSTVISQIYVAADQLIRDFNINDFVSLQAQSANYKFVEGCSLVSKHVAEAIRMVEVGMPTTVKLYELENLLYSDHGFITLIIRSVARFGEETTYGDNGAYLMFHLSELRSLWLDYSGKSPMRLPVANCYSYAADTSVNPSTEKLQAFAAAVCHYGYVIIKSLLSLMMVSGSYDTYIQDYKPDEIAHMNSFTRFVTAVAVSRPLFNRMVEAVEDYEEIFA
jgi:hypothetical protein